MVELEEARRTNPGTVWQPRRHILLQCPPCNGDCCQGRCCPADACATEGGQHADPVPSGTTRRDVIGARIGFVLLLVSAVTVVGIVSFAVLARWPMAWPLG